LITQGYFLAFRVLEMELLFSIGTKRSSKPSSKARSEIVRTVGFLGFVKSRRILGLTNMRSSAYYKEMATRKTISLEKMVAKRPLNEKRVRKLRDSIIAESRALRLGEFRKSLDLTQVDLAQILGVDQSNISRIERGKLSKTEIGTLESYVEALGGTLEITVRIGKVSHILIDTDSSQS